MFENAKIFQMLETSVRQQMTRLKFLIALTIRTNKITHEISGREKKREQLKENSAQSSNPEIMRDA